MIIMKFHGFTCMSKLNKLCISDRCSILHVNYTCIKLFKLVQKTNLDLSFQKIGFGIIYFLFPDNLGEEAFPVVVNIDKQ